MAENVNRSIWWVTMSGEYDGDVDFLAMHAEAVAGGGDDFAVMEGIAEFRQMAHLLIAGSAA